MPSRLADDDRARRRPWAARRGRSRTGSATSVRPRSAISKTPISLVDPNRFLTAREHPVGVVLLALEVEHGVDQVLEHARARPAPLPW